MRTYMNKFKQHTITQLFGIIFLSILLSVPSPIWPRPIDWRTVRLRRLRHVRPPSPRVSQVDQLRHDHAQREGDHGQGQQCPADRSPNPCRLGRHVLVHGSTSHARSRGRTAICSAPLGGRYWYSLEIITTRNF